MATVVREVMTREVCELPPSSTVTEAARAMRDRDLGDVVVAEDGSPRGVVTDRDIVLRAVAEGDDGGLQLGEMCSRRLRTLSPDDSLEDAARCMRTAAVRRLVVVEDGRIVGVLSMGDLLAELEPGSPVAGVLHSTGARR
jgi:CBS domain-containing protein